MSGIVALAGHVDHGKSALVTALTGVRTDRLDHEVSSGHTIEVLPAHLPDAGVTLLDAPGHADWLTATLAGLGAATHVLVVVAADDGPMPQTVDHVTAVAALHLSVAAVAVTRTDLVSARRVRSTIAATHDLLASLGVEVPVTVATSTTTGAGLDRLRATMAQVRAPATLPPLAGPDLWVDRSFVVPGRGRVVVGTLRRGTVAVDDVLVEAVSGDRVRVRGIEHRGRAVTTITGTRRVALRLSTDHHEVPRGARYLGPDVARHGLLRGAVRATVGNLGDYPITRRGSWTMHAGTGSVAVEVAPDRTIPPGHSGAVVVRPHAGFALRPGERFVLRDTGRRRVCAGGMSLAAERRPRASSDRLQALEAAFVAGDRAGIRAGLAHVNGGIVDRRHVATVVPVAQAGGRDASPRLTTAVLDAVTGRLAATPTGAADLATVTSAVSAELDLDEELVGAVVRDGPFTLVGAQLRLGTSTASPVRDGAAAVLAELAAAGLAPPRITDLVARHDVDRGVLHGLVRSGDLHQGGPFLFTRDAVAAATATVAELPEPFTVARARDALGVTRRHAVPLLELLDRLGVTQRDGDQRRLA